jgi:hypothetical protein
LPQPSNPGSLQVIDFVEQKILAWLVWGLHIKSVKKQKEEEENDIRQIYM